MVFQNSCCSPGRFLTWRDIADYLGLTIETVSRTITQFENDAVIGIASARRIVLRDRAAVTRVAVHDNSTSSYRYRDACGHNQIWLLSDRMVSTLASMQSTLGRHVLC
jgi:hypothetical protein